MATQILTIGQFDNGAAIVRVAYDDQTGDVLGFRTVIARGQLMATLQLTWGEL